MAVKAKKTEEAVKDKTYVLLTKNPPMQLFLRNRHKKGSPLQFFDEGEETLKSLCYGTNQKSVFEDEQSGDVILGSIIFQNGKLTVPRTNPQLQKFLEITPDNGIVFEEFKPDEIAEKELSSLEVEMESLQTAMALTLPEIESIALSLYGSSVLSKKTAEVKRDVFLYAKSNPESFMKLASDDLTKLKGLAVRATELNLAQYKGNAFYNGETLLCKVPFDETDKFNTLARWMNDTDEGKAFNKYVQSKIK